MRAEKGHDQCCTDMEAEDCGGPDGGGRRAGHQEVWCRRFMWRRPSSATRTISTAAGFSYGRPDNATVRQAEAVIAALEGADEALLFASGMAAATAVVLALDPGAHIVAPKVMYWAFATGLPAWRRACGYRVDLVDMTDLAAVRRRSSPTRKLVWVETPANPLWTITDIAAVAEIAHAAGALLAVDSTAATPVLTQPLRARRRHRHALGDQVPQRPFRRHRRRARRCARDEHWQRIARVRTQHGAILGPFEAWLLLRGLRTLYVRVQAQADERGPARDAAQPAPRGRRGALSGARRAIRATRSRHAR